MNDYSYYQFNEIINNLIKFNNKKRASINHGWTFVWV
jgi:hypothetical protein